MPLWNPLNRWKSEKCFYVNLQVKLMRENCDRKIISNLLPHLTISTNGLYSKKIVTFNILRWIVIWHQYEVKTLKRISQPLYRLKFEKYYQTFKQILHAYDLKWIDKNWKPVQVTSSVTLVSFVSVTFKCKFIWSSRSKFYNQIMGRGFFQR